MELYKSKFISFDDLLYTNDENKKLLPLVLAIDEPEVHLNPYLQRSLIRYYKQILCNENSGFVQLLNDCFGIDGLDGQLIIVTHSTDALVGDYHNLIRFYMKEGKTSVISGYDLSSIKPNNKEDCSETKVEKNSFRLLGFNNSATHPIESTNERTCITQKEEKHLVMRFPEIKEAFYAKCVIFIEGETEYGCIPAFAEKTGIALDDYGICVINARGESSIRPLRKLLDLFAIPSIAIYDRDARSTEQLVDEFFTGELCFEVELVQTLFKKGSASLVQKIASSLDDKAMSVTLGGISNNCFKKLGVDMSKYKDKKLCDADISNENEFCKMYSVWFMAKKGVLLGRIVGKLLNCDLIPTCYKTAINRAREIAVNGK